MKEKETFDAMLEVIKRPGRPEDCPLCPEPEYCIKCKYLSKCGDLGPIEDNAVYERIFHEDVSKIEVAEARKRSIRKKIEKEKNKK